MSIPSLSLIRHHVLTGVALHKPRNPTRRSNLQSPNTSLISQVGKASIALRSRRCLYVPLGPSKSHSPAEVAR